MNLTRSRDQPILLFLFACWTLLVPLQVRAEPPVLRSGSKIITIIDGDHVKTNYWVVMPERNPDVYYVEIPMKAHSVTFRSDIDSITIPVAYGEDRDFVVLLNGLPCATRIRAVYRNPQPYSRIGGDNTIPFRLGDNDKIYLKGTLNGSEPLDFQFDLGAGGSLIKKGSEAKAKMRFDGTTHLQNSDGDNVVPTSSRNQLRVGPFQWEGLSFAVADNMTHREDALLGNTLFQDKVLEIDYDLGTITVHDELPAKVAGFTRHPIILDGVVPFIRGTLAMGGEEHTGWFLFDTGAYTSILYSDKKSSPVQKLLSEFRGLFGKRFVAGPRLSVGDYAFTDFNYSARREHKGDNQLGLIGNDILKRFNVILDNQNGFIYLRPNSLTAQPFRNPEFYLARFIAAGVAVLGLGSLLRNASYRSFTVAAQKRMR